MKILERCTSCVCLVLAVCLVGCYALEPVPSPSAVTPLPATFVSPVPSDVPLPTSPTPPSTLKVSTSTPPRRRFRTVRITEQSVAGAYWSEDGWSVIYATSGERYGMIGKWWRYEVSMGERHPVEPPFNLKPEIWAQLEASYIDDVGAYRTSGTEIASPRFRAQTLILRNKNLLMRWRDHLGGLKWPVGASFQGSTARISRLGLQVSASPRTNRCAPMMFSYGSVGVFHPVVPVLCTTACHQDTVTRLLLMTSPCPLTRPGQLVPTEATPRGYKAALISVRLFGLIRREGYSWSAAMREVVA